MEQLELSLTTGAICKLIQLWKTVWQYLLKKNINTLNNTDRRYNAQQIRMYMCTKGYV